MLIHDERLLAHCGVHVTYSLVSLELLGVGTNISFMLETSSFKLQVEPQHDVDRCARKIAQALV